jgi:hypothetical protein
MTRLLIPIAMMLALAGTGYEASIAYFSRERSVAVNPGARQNYVSVDADVWKYARPDLGDIRIYDGQTQVPYQLLKQSGGSVTQEAAAKILNLGEVGGHTEFDLDVGGLPEYDRVRLNLDAKNFINATQVQGRQALSERSGTNVGNTTLYDFTAEGLGNNSVLKFSTSSFPYLHVKMAPGILPKQVKGAYISNFAETKATWTSAGMCNSAGTAGKESLFDCTISEKMPVERIAVKLPESAVNFNRTVFIGDETSGAYGTGAISRVRMTRNGQSVTSENLTLDTYSQTAGKMRIRIENGDDPPLPIESVEALSYERRVYFDPHGKTGLKMYYGDEKLSAPSYDYAKFFQQDPDAAVAQMGASEANAEFTGRPDERPWSERHKGVLWAAMILAVLVLGALALRGLKADARS